MRRSPHHRANFPPSCSSLNSRNTSASVVRSVRAISSVDRVNSFLVLCETRMHQKRPRNAYGTFSPSLALRH